MVTPERVAVYLPAGYQVVGYLKDVGLDTVLIAGVDEAGWTFEDYVQPRLASGLYFATELLEAVGYE